jgi:hypothetical protein
MKRGYVVLIAALVLSCATPVPTTSPLQSNSEPQIHCGDVFTRSQCEAIASSALAVSVQPGALPIDVWVRGFTLCSNEANLFDMNALNCPVPPPPTSGVVWRAGVEVAFQGGGPHGGVNVAEVSGHYVAHLIGYRTPDPGWCDWIGDCGASPS